MGDIERGRLFRVSKNKEYKVKPVDVSTIEGAIEALKNPNRATRYLGWKALHEAGQEAESALVKLYEDPNPVYQARALWLLSKLPETGTKHISTALKNENSDIRITAIRAARQLDGEIKDYLKQILRDPSPQVRREVAIAIRFDSSEAADQMWTELALQYQGNDRWYVEALGIGADLQWENRLANWLAKVGENWNTPAGRDIIWRSRASKTPAYLTSIIKNSDEPTEQLARYFRAFDFQTNDEQKTKALLDLALMKPASDPDRKRIYYERNICSVRKCGSWEK